MIRAHSQRVLQPYSAQVQIAESETARALSMDGDHWEFQFIFSPGRGASASGGQRRGRFVRAASIQHSDLQQLVADPKPDQAEVDKRIIELARFVLNASLPFPAADRYEYWLLDAADHSPLALIFSCTEASQMESFPDLTDWAALPAAVMPIETSEEERSRTYGPVNYRLERCVAERAGSKPRAQWFERGEGESARFPPFLLRDDWPTEESHELCQRYLNRQAPRLLMLQGLTTEQRRRLELAAKANVLDVARFYPLYPEVADQAVIDSIRIEARLRAAAGEKAYAMDRRDGVHYQ